MMVKETSQGPFSTSYQFQRKKKEA